MVPPKNATRITDAQGTTADREASAINSGNERQTPASGKYRRCSKRTSAIGTTLDVGDSVMKNQRIENASTGCCRRIRHATNKKAAIRAIDPNTAGSKMVEEGRKS